MTRRSLLSAALAMIVLGCESTPPPPPPPTPAEAAKATLDRASKDGQVGSDVLALQSYFEEMKKTEPAKADALLKDLQLLIQNGTQPNGGNPDLIKKTAKKMVEKL